jgi:hypothetical protein
MATYIIISLPQEKFEQISPQNDEVLQQCGI